MQGDSKLTLSVDAMGGDNAPKIVLDGMAMALEEGLDVQFLLHGDEAQLKPFLDADSRLKSRTEIRHSDTAIAMDAKPSQAVRRGKGSSMWQSIAAVKAGDADIAVSAGNTGALMAMSTLILRTATGVSRPAIAASWPTLNGQAVVLDVGADIKADSQQLVEFAAMGASFASAVHGKDNPSVGLLNIGEEELKGIDSVKLANDYLKSIADLNYYGFVEGNDISMGTTDVVVTDGYTGNIALKTAEGTAKLIASFLREALTSSSVSKLGAVLASGGLKTLKDRMDPRKVNGGVFLGLNGVVVKSHGGTDEVGFCTTLNLAAKLGQSKFSQTVADKLLTIQSAKELRQKEAVTT